VVSWSFLQRKSRSTGSSSLSFLRFCRGRVIAFHGREEVLDRVKAYLEAPASAPLVSAVSLHNLVLRVLLPFLFPRILSILVALFTCRSCMARAEAARPPSWPRLPLPPCTAPSRPLRVPFSFSASSGRQGMKRWRLCRCACMRSAHCPLHPLSL